MRSIFFFLIFCLLLLPTVLPSPNDIDLNSLSLDKGFSILAESADDLFGYSADGAGDVNDDGIDDLIISAKGIGTVYVLFGNKNGLSNVNLATGLSSTQGFKINGLPLTDAFGYTVTGAGDLNEDGIADIAIGAIHAQYVPTGLAESGCTIVFFGEKNWSPSLINIITAISTPNFGLTIEGDSAFGYLGHSISITGDINGDGVDDIITTAPGVNSKTGNAYIIYGKKIGIPAINHQLANPSDLTLSTGFRVVGDILNSYLGNSASAVDFNGDGIDDILLGAPTYGATGLGRAFIIFGRKGGPLSDIYLSNFSPSQGIVIQGSYVGDFFGFSVSNAGDVNGDGIADIIIGASRASPFGRVYSGTVYVFFGKKTGLSNIDLAKGLNIAQGFKIEGSNRDLNLGLSATRARDINGDGIDDILIGAYSNIATESTAYVIYGRKTGIINIDLENGLEETRGFTIRNSGILKIGYKVAHAGDVNGDGKPDIIIGALTDSGSPSGAFGKSYIIYGFEFPGIELIQVIANTQGAVTQVARGFALLLTLINFSNAGAVLFTALAEILHYMKYMSIQYPPRLQYILDQPDPEFINIPYISSVPQEVEDMFTHYVLPENFEKYEIHSSFLVNCWSPIITLAIIIGGIIIVYLGVFATPSCKFIHSKFAKLKEALKWNYLLAIFTGYFGDIGFYTAFQFWMTRYNTGVDRTSFFLCILFNIAVLGISGRIINVIYKIVKEYKYSQQFGHSKRLEKLKEEYKAYQVIFEGFKSNSLLHQSYLLLFNLRLYFFNSIITYVFEHPLAQAIIINVQGVIFLVYLLFLRPIKDKKDFVGSVAQEVILQIVHVCVLCLAIIDDMDVKDSSLKVIAGDIIIACNAIFVLVGVICILISLICLIRDLINALRKKSNQSHSNKFENTPNLPTQDGSSLTVASKKNVFDRKKHQRRANNIYDSSASDETIQPIDLHHESSVWTSQDNKTNLSIIENHSPKRDQRKVDLKESFQFHSASAKAKKRIATRSKTQKK